MIISKLNDDGHEHWESLLLVRLQYIEEVVVLEETHGPIGYLQMNSSDAVHNPLEQFRNQVAHFLDFAHFQHLLQLC